MNRCELTELAVLVLTQYLHCLLVCALSFSSSPPLLTFFHHSFVLLFFLGFFFFFTFCVSVLPPVLSSSLFSLLFSLQPVRNHNPWMLLFFISFLLIVSFFVLNMFVGVVVENFHKCRQQQEEEEARLREEKRQKRLEKRRRSEEAFWESGWRDIRVKYCAKVLSHLSLLHIWLEKWEMGAAIY